MEREDIVRALKVMDKMPYNYRFINTIASEEELEKKEVNVVKNISIRDYNSTIFQTCPHHKPISKIIDFKPFLKDFKK